MGDEQKTKKRKKGYYIKASKGKKVCYGHRLEPGLKGFLITCNNREREAVREAYNILNEYTEILFGSDKEVAKESESQTSEIDSDDPEDIEAALKKEVASIKEEQQSTKRRFQVVDSGAKNCVFIRTTLTDPVTLVHKFLSDVSSSKTAKSRHMMRIHPIVGTCRTSQDKVRQLAEDNLIPYMATGQAKTYCILIKIRNNSEFGRGDIFPIVRQTIQDMNPAHGFDDKDPDYVFSFDVIRNVCCLSVMPDYYKLKKYNVQEITKHDHDSAKETRTVERESTRPVPDNKKSANNELSSSDNKNNTKCLDSEQNEGLSEERPKGNS